MDKTGRKCKVIAIANQKGGVSKSTSAMNLGIGLARAGKEVLGIDLDSHIAYVLGCLRVNTRKVGNIRSYLLTALYNAAMTIDNYYQAEVNHDMYGGG